MRTLCEAAAKQGIHIPREFVFFDMAMAGYKDRRPGLNKLRDLLDTKAVQVLLVFATNRLFRKTYKALQFVAEEVVERGIRCLLIKSGIDSADEKGWQSQLQVHAMIDELVVGMYADNVRAAHEGLFDRQMICGTLTFGYAGEPIPGEFTNRKKPRCRIIVDPITSKIVIQVFDWYVRDRLTIEEILRRLNANPDIPLGPKCLSGQWTRLGVRRILSNLRYRGSWSYGTTKNVWQSKGDYNRQVRRDEPLRTLQIEDLRIVEDTIWYEAQKRLAAAEKIAAGRKPRNAKNVNRPKLLHGLFRCPTHAQILHVGGVDGNYLFCSACKKSQPESRPLYSQLPRKLALTLTCQKLAQVLQDDVDLASRVVEARQQAATKLQQADPTRLDYLRKEQQQLDRQIQFLLQNAGETEVDQRESQDALRSLRRKRGELVAELQCLANASKEIRVPSEHEIRELVKQYTDILLEAAESENVEDQHTVREVLRCLTGGHIDLYQQGERAAQRGWLQGRFQAPLFSALANRITEATVNHLDAAGVDVVIDYKAIASMDEYSNRAKELYDQGLLHKQIAAKIGCARNWVTELLRHWFESRRMPVPDGRSRRATLTQKQSETPLFDQLADEATNLWNQGLSELQIAEQLGCSPPTVVRAVARWHEARGLPVPTWEGRRQQLIDRM